MKKKILLVFFISLVKISFAQEGENPLPYVQKEVAFDTAPLFPGGPDAMMRYFEDSIRYPEPEKTKRLEGNVSLKFDVTTEGKIKNVQLLNGVLYAPNLAKEAVRIMESMPLWIPARKKGKAIEAEYYLSIPFKIVEQRNIK